MNKRKLSLKWFGSLSNLSTRRSSVKSLPSPQPAPVHDGSEATKGQWAAELKPLSLGPCYARSSDMYTHVGTVPRSDKHSKKKLSFRRSTKGTKKNEKEEVRLTSPAENVMDSPLLGALRALKAPSPLTSPSSPLTSASSPLTCGVLKTDEKTTHQVSEKVFKSGESKDMSRPQDLYVQMDPINEAQKEAQIRQDVVKKQNKQGVETWDRENDTTDVNGAYVKFSKEKPCLDPREKQIEEDELKLESVACYYGPLPPELCETLLLTPGDFLIRDSMSSRGDLVLSCHWGRGLLHFLVGVQRCEGRVLFSVSGQSFPSLPELTHFYTNSRASLSQSRKVHILRPVDRTFPLSHSQTKFNTVYTCPDSPSTLHREAEVNRDNPQMSDVHSHVHLSSTNCISPQPLSPGCSRSNSFSLSPTKCSDANDLLTLTIPHNNPSLDQDSDQDSSGYTKLYPKSFVDRLDISEKSPEQLKAKEDTWFCPTIESTSCFSSSLYQSALMPRENKPLEVNILRRVKEILLEIDPKMAAKHMTKADCKVARILEVSPEAQRMMGVSCGVELLTLPHGQQLRLDLLERFETMAITLAVHVLGCTGTCEERAALIHKLILIAAELKSSLGNLFGFAAVMRALQLPQVSRLEQTWATLRQRHTDGAVLFEKTLRPFMKSLNEGRESCPLSSTSFPHVLPLLCLLERGALGPGLSVGEGPETWDTELGVDVVMFHLSAARTFAQLGDIYSNNAHSQLLGLEEQVDISELFHTDFQLRLLWGSRGAGEKQSLRYNKFNQVLTALSKKLEPPNRIR